jgi:AP-4 complex subunit epsilon-1
MLFACVVLVICSDIVRKKAVCALHRFYQLDPSSISTMGDKIRRALCDKDPSVMAASLCLLHDLIRDNANTYKDLVSSFVSILKQITEHRLPRTCFPLPYFLVCHDLPCVFPDPAGEFDYHRQPAPWIQMHLLRILAMLGKGDQVASEGMYEVLVDVMRRADTGINIGYAVVYECVRTITTIYPNNALLDAAASSISRFIRRSVICNAVCLQ